MKCSITCLPSVISKSQSISLETGQAKAVMWVNIITKNTMDDKVVTKHFMNVVFSLFTAACRITIILHPRWYLGHLVCHCRAACSILETAFLSRNAWPSGIGSNHQSGGLTYTWSSLSMQPYKNACLSVLYRSCTGCMNLHPCWDDTIFPPHKNALFPKWIPQSIF